MGTASSTPLALTLHDAIDRGLKANLGLLVNSYRRMNPPAASVSNLSALLPQAARTGETDEQTSLKTISFNFQFPGVSIPTILRAVSLHRRGRFRIPGTHSITAPARIIDRRRRATAPHSSP